MKILRRTSRFSDELCSGPCLTTHLRMRASRHAALTGKDEVIGDLANAMLTYTTRHIVYKSFSKSDVVTFQIDSLQFFENNKGALPGKGPWQRLHHRRQVRRIDHRPHQNLGLVRLIAALIIKIRWKQMRPTMRGTLSWLDALELRDVITVLAEDLHAFRSWDIGAYSNNEELGQLIWDKYPGFQMEPINERKRALTGAACLLYLCIYYVLTKMGV
ncbi:MAG: hypothetical protein HY911_11095 [Desulfobacterales bacterium]|nr:hypothetical protein [Desulfobacterales bacterium]